LCFISSSLSRRSESEEGKDSAATRRVVVILENTPLCRAQHVGACVDHCDGKGVVDEDMRERAQGFHVPRVVVDAKTERSHAVCLSLGRSASEGVDALHVRVVVQILVHADRLLWGSCSETRL
jgi:hypothetical protein